jgi:hypothetical protein
MRTVFSILSLIGFSLKTTSAILGMLTIAFAQLHHFEFYDPLLLRIFRWGILLSLAGIPFSIAGVWRASSLRWLAPACSIGTLAFWILAAAGE